MTQQAAWQPIATVPKVHRKHILLFGDGIGFKQCSFIGIWEDDLADWRETYGNREVKPTHWMELPDPPLANGELASPKEE